MVGKTIARIEESPTDAEYGHQSDDTLLIHFTDGTALRIEGHSYEEVSLSFEEESPAEIRARQKAAIGRREKERLRRLKREEWLSISCEERAARKAAAEAKLSPESRGLRNIMTREMSEMMEDTFLASSRMMYGDVERVVRLRCPKCGERQCENAPTKTYPATQGYGGFWAGTHVSPAA